MVTGFTKNASHELSLIEMGTCAGEVSRLLRALAHPARLVLASTLVEREYAVGELEKKLDIHQPVLSQQLTVLRKARLIASRRQGKQAFYRLADPRVGTIISLVQATLAK